MEDIRYIYYRDFLIKNKRIESGVLITKIGESYLVGPIINDFFDENSFVKRVSSSSVYSLKKYRKFSRRNANRLVRKYFDELRNNEVLEVLKNGDLIKHNIIKVPGGKYEE